MSADSMQVREGAARYLAEAHAQDVPHGYKRTEVGVIPEDWILAPLSSAVASLHAGVSVNSTIADSGSYGSVPAILKTSCVQSGNFLPHEAKNIAPSDRHRAALNPRRDTIIISRMNTIDLVGECGFVDRDYPDLFVPDRLWMTLLHPSSSVSPRWLAYVLSSADYRKQLQSIATGTSGSMKNIAKASLLALQLAYPPPPEQRAIVVALSDVDGMIGALEKLIAKKRAIKQAAMQQLLTGKTRLPGFSAPWATKRLGEIAMIRNQKVMPSNVDPDTPCVELEHIGQGDGRLLEHSTARHSTSSKYRFSTGDVLFGRLRSYLRKYWLADRDGICTTEIWPLMVDPRQADSGFLLGIVQTDRFIESASISYGTHMPRADWGVMRNFEVQLPDVNEQTAIATVLSDMDAEIAALERRRDKTRAIKQGMMQQLLTGRIRLVKPSVAVIEKATEKESSRKANVHFIRSVLAAEIIDQLHDQPTFGHVKFEKMIFLVEHLCEVDTGSTYHRKAAGPYDNRALRSIDSQLRAQQWFDARKEGKRYQYVPMQNRGGHKRYFDRYFSGLGETFDRIIGTFKTLDTERCEIVATLLAVWSDLLRDNGTVSDELIVHEVLNNWHEAKRRIPGDRWLKALDWMRSRGFVPKGAA
ncbi:MAG: restriction endonuclease subunit S [Pseudomonadales bacterium]|nr:restriction endonuclease subunit S [Pseudomonadales bacterium]